MLKLIQQTLPVGGQGHGQVIPTTVGVPQGSPISPVYSNISLNLRDHLWHTRGYPVKLGATVHRYADDALLVCRSSPQPARATFEAIAKRME
jgi:retron-type reverse transcriptase